MGKWPRDNQAALIKFYGDPGGDEVARQLVKVAPPFRMTYDGRALASLSFHKKAAPALLAALTKIWVYYDKDQSVIDKLGISKTAGTYNPRKVRGSATKWSNHAYGAAIDINAEQNGFNVAGNIPLPMIAAFKSEGARWGGDYKGRKDPMHFEFCDSGEPQRSFEEWLATLGVPAKPKSKVKLPLPAPPEMMDFVDPTPLMRPTPTVVEPPVAKPAVVPPPAAEGVQGDPEIWNVQRRLKAMNYNPGGMDGVWGGLTAGAISGFINDRRLAVAPPTSPDAFLDMQEAFKVELGRAEAERFVRPVSPERAAATPATLAPKLPEVKAAVQAERLGFWGSIGLGITTAISGVGKFLGEAVEWLNPVKEFIGDLPWPVWAGGALLGAAALYYISRKSGEAANASTQAYQEGSRS